MTHRRFSSHRVRPVIDAYSDPCAN